MDQRTLDTRTPTTRMNHTALDRDYIASSLRRLNLLHKVGIKLPIPYYEDPTSTSLASYNQRRSHQNSRLTLQIVDLRKRIDDHITTYAAPRCLLLCNMMPKLPRELRDMIYTQLIDRKTVRIFDKNLLPRSSGIVYKRMLFLGLGSKYLLDDAFADRATQREFLETWCETCTFSFENAGMIDTACDYDFWNMGLRLRDRIRNVEITPWAALGIGKNDAVYQEQRARYLEGLEALCWLSGLRKVQISLLPGHWGGGWSTNGKLTNFVLVFLESKAWMERLLDKGCMVMVKVDTDWGFWVEKREVGFGCRWVGGEDGALEL